MKGEGTTEPNKARVLMRSREIYVRGTSLPTPTLTYHLHTVDFFSFQNALDKYIHKSGNLWTRGDSIHIYYKKLMFVLKWIINFSSVFFHMAAGFLQV